MRFRHIHEHPEIDQRDLALVRQWQPAARTILDVGAGTGGFVIAATRAGFTAFGLDLGADAPMAWPAAGVSGVRADALHPPFRRAAFDVVRAKEIVEHVVDPLGLVRAMRWLVKPGGLLLAHVPTPFSQVYPVANFWDDYTHVRPFSRAGLQRLFEDGGLTVRSIRGYTAGRGRLERVAGALLSRIMPHTYVLVAQLDAGAS